MADRLGASTFILELTYMNICDRWSEFVETNEPKTYLFPGFLETISKVAGTLNGSPFRVREGFTGGCSCSDHNTHDDRGRKDACQVDLCGILKNVRTWILQGKITMIYLFVGQRAYGTDVHRGVHDQLLELRKLWGIVIPDELEMKGAELIHA